MSYKEFIKQEIKTAKETNRALRAGEDSELHKLERELGKLHLENRRLRGNPYYRKMTSVLDKL